MRGAFKPLNIEDAFDDYMRRTLPEVKREDVQYRESRRVFFAAFGRAFHYMAFEITKLSDEDAEKELQRLGDEAAAYWVLAVLDRD